MPNLRCMHYAHDGTPISGGCKAPGCRYIHPHEKGWGSAPSFKSYIRCMHYDSGGKSISGGCRFSSENCRFVHPDDPRWDLAEGSRPHLDRSFTKPGSAAPSAAPSTSHLTRIEPDQRLLIPRSFKTSGAARQFLPKLKTDVTKTGHDQVDPRSSLTPKSKDTSTAAPPTDHGLILKHNLSTASRLSPMSSRNPQADSARSSAIPTSAVSQGADGDPRWVWKRRLALLAQAIELQQKIAEIDADLGRQTDLQLTGIISAMAPSARASYEAFKYSSAEKRKVLEDKLDAVVVQLIEADFWPLLVTTESAVSVDQNQPHSYANIEELGRRLDMVGAQITKSAANMDNSSNQKDSAPRVREVEENPLRPPKRRRISSDGSPLWTSDQDVLGRLDQLQHRANQLEGEALYGDRLVEKIDDILEDRLFKTPPIADHHEPLDGSDDMALEAGHAVLPSLAESLKDVIRKLDSDLDVFYGELADLPANDDLSSQIAALRVENGATEEAMTHVASNLQSLQEQQANLEQQMRQIMEELDGLQIIPHTSGCDRVVSDLTADIQEHVDTNLVQLQDVIKSHHEGLKTSVLASLEPTIHITETIYTSMASRFQVERPN